MEDISCESVKTSFFPQLHGCAHHFTLYEHWQQHSSHNKKEYFFIQPLWIVFNGVLFLFMQWVTATLTPKPGSLSCFTAHEMLAYPLAYIISPAALVRSEWVGGCLGARGGGCSREVGARQGRQVVKFPLADTSLAPSGWLSHELRFSSRSVPRGIWGAASSDSSFSPMSACWLTERPQKYPVNPNCFPLTAHTRRTQNAGRNE